MSSQIDVRHKRRTVDVGHAVSRNDPSPGVTNTPPSEPIRIEIQALRALAISLVLIYHVWPDRLPGGYVGVDVFFVVSGYLITAHLLREAVRTDRISLLRFWARRARRLLPAALIVLAFCVLVAAFLMRSQSEQNLWQTAAAALYVENWALAFNAVDYLGADDAPSLVQHFWSLSVEEQFYFIWPTVIILGLWVARKTARNLTATIAILLGAIFIASLIHSIAITADRPSQAYFFTTARTWEFAAGGMLALIPARLLRDWTGSPASMLLGWLGILGIAFTALAYSDNTAFPGYAALLPVAATAMVLIFGASGAKGSVASVAHHRPVLVLGDLSYGLYLWHWPLIVVGTILCGGSMPFAVKLLVVAVSVGAAYVMKISIEDPARFRWRFVRTTHGAFAFMVIGMTLVAATSVGAITYKRDVQGTLFASTTPAAPCWGAAVFSAPETCQDPYLVPPDLDTSLASNDVYWREGSVQAGGVCAPEGDVPTSCTLGSSEPSLKVAFIGSSHGQHILDPMDTAAKALGWQVTPHVRARCSGFDSPTQAEARISDDPSIADDVRECQSWSQAVFAKTVEDPEISAVIISARGIGATDFAVERVRAYVEAGKQVVWLGDTPDMPTAETAPVCIEQSNSRVDPCRYPEPADPGRGVAAELGVPYIDLHSNFCDDAGCHVVIGGVVTFFDNNHLTLTYARTLAPFLERALDEAIH